MKINGSSKIISDKEKQEKLVSIAEASDLLHSNVIEHDTSKMGQAKRKAQELLARTKPFREKQMLLAGEAIKKVRGLSPYIDRSITTMDTAIDYITKSEKIENRSEVVQETRPPAVFGIWVMIITFGVGMVWAMLAPLDSASHALGKIILDSKKRIIQHPEGGVVKEILVRDGDQVTKGQTLLILDDTEIRARKKQYEYKYLSNLAEVARLTAERDNLEEVNFPEELLKHIADPEIKEMIQNQEKFFLAKKQAYTSQVAQKETITAQYYARKNALLPQIESADKLIKITSDQVETYKKLLAKGNVNKAYLQDAQARKAQHEGSKGQLIGQLAEVEQAVIQTQIDLDNYKHKVLEDNADRLKQTQTELSINYEALKGESERLRRSVVTAPEDGNISNLNDHLTPHSVLGAQQVLMEIIPQDDKLVVEAKIPAEDIAAVKVGQVSMLSLIHI